MYRCTERWQANSYLAWLDNIRQKKAGRSSVGNNMIASFQLPLDFCNQLTRRLVRRWKKGRDILVQTAVVLNPVSEVWSLWMDWKQGGKKKKKLSWLLIISLWQQLCRWQSPELQPQLSPAPPSARMMCCSCLNHSDVCRKEEKKIIKCQSPKATQLISWAKQNKFFKNILLWPC